LTGLGEWAFAENPSLTSVTMGSSVTIVSNYAFQNDVSLTSVTFGSLVSIIGNGAFEGATALRNVTIPSTVTYIGPGAYGGNGNLKSVTFAGAPPVSTGIHNQYPGFWAADSNTPSLGNVANVAVYFAPEFAVPGFAGGFTAPVWEGYQSALPSTIVNNLVYDILSGTEVALVGNTLVAPTNLTIPSSVTIGGNDYTVASIGFGAFHNSSTLTAVTIPASVTKIGQRAFSGNPSLTSVTFVGAPPATITVAGELASLGTAVGLKVHFSQEFLAPSFMGGFTLPWWQGYVTGIIPFVENPTPATVGQTLSVDPGPWSPVADSFSYQWKRGGVAIENATASTYTLKAGDFGRAVTVTVTAMKDGHATTPITSAGTALVLAGPFVLAPLPTISGTMSAGQRLSVVPGIWSPSASFTYVWKRGGVPIVGATRNNYVVTVADGGSQITVEVTGSRVGFQTASKTSLETVAVAASAFVAAPNPTISGTAILGQRLTIGRGVWSPSAALTYAWKRDNVEVVGATRNNYVLGTADIGKKISVVVSGSKTGYETTLKESAQTAAVAGASFVTAPTPVITGAARVGQKLGIDRGIWSPSACIAFVWKRNGDTISGAVNSSYRLTIADLGAKITVELTGSRNGFQPTAKVSAPSATVTR
jgi:hypothetical protein